MSLNAESAKSWTRTGFRLDHTASQLRTAHGVQTFLLLPAKSIPLHPGWLLREEGIPTVLLITINSSLTERASGWTAGCREMRLSRSGSG